VKILYLTPGCFDKGGISRYSRYQITALRELVGAANVKVHSILGPTHDDFEDDFEVTSYAGGLSTFNKFNYLRNVLTSALLHHPDVIFSAHINISGVTQLLAKLTGAKTVLNVYGLEVWSGLRRDAAWGLKTSDHVISDCNFTAQYLEEKRLRKKGTTSVIWDCVDLNRFFPAPSTSEVLKKYGIPDPAHGLNLLTLGRMTHDAAHKGYDRLLEVFARIAGELPQLRLIYAGRGEMVDYLRKKVSELGLDGRVFFTGTIHEQDLPNVYRSSHLFSLVSDRGVGRGEGIPLTPLEAAACGVPILVGNHDGSQEAVEQGVNGYILNPFDLDSHAQAIISLSKNEALRARMGEAAHRRIVEDFAYPKFLEKCRILLSSWFPQLSKLTLAS
jgi:phosphatidylinositol alpha-1,6-mannosyltransferase